jgi:site-specific DNA-methyltransferase (adenine-specific)
MQLLHGDCLELMKELPDNSVDLVLTDPPYNIGVTSSVNGKTVVNKWDKIENYIDWCMDWLNECARVLKPQGVLYFFHNDMAQIAELLENIKARTPLAFVSFCIWDKGDTYRSLAWHNRDTESNTALRSWFNVCEYCLHFFNTNPNEVQWNKTGLDRIYSNPECFKPLKEWYQSEMERLGLTAEDIKKKYTEATDKKPYMLRHYFQNSQFEIPTKEIYDKVYRALGFGKEYEELRKEYEELRNYHKVDRWHCNVWHIPPIPSANRLHTCQKPVQLLERLINVSCRQGGVVLDCFMGSGSTGVACVNTGRDFIGIELDDKYYDIACKRIAAAEEDKAAEDAQMRMVL